MSDENKNNRFHTNKIQVNEISEKTKESIKSRFAIAAVLIALLVPASVLGGYFFFGLMAIAFLVGIIEAVRAPRKNFPAYVYVAVIIMMIAIAFFPFFRDSMTALIKTGQWSFDLERSMRTLYISPVTVAISFLLLFWFSIMDERISFPDVTYLIVMVLLLGLGMQSALYIRYLPFDVVPVAEAGSYFKYWQSLELLYFILLGSLMNDTFAYFVGIFFGKHKMNERISPKKTWEGFFGGWVLGGAFAIAFGILCAVFGSPMLPGLLDLDHWYLIVIGGFLLPLLGDLGDLAFSSIKRHYGFKDFGDYLGAHGGVLDRIDSSVFCLIGFSAFLSMVMTIMGAINA